MNEDKLDKACPICSASVNQINTLYLLGLIDSATFFCSHCGLYFRQPLPDEKAVSKYYTARYFRHADEIERKMAQIQGNWIIDTLKQKEVNPSKLYYTEFGAGRGWLVSFMQNQTIAAIGYEPDSKSVQWGRSEFKIDLREGFLEDSLKDVSLPRGSIISLVHVLEHFQRPLETLVTIRDKYKTPYLFLEVPNAVFEGPVIALDVNPKSSMGQHFWSFTEQSLNILLKKTGYSIMATQKAGFPDFWNDTLAALKIREKISSYHREWHQNQFNLKKEMIRSLQMASLCLAAGIKMRIRRLKGKNRSRLDLPVIRILAKAI